MGEKIESFRDLRVYQQAFDAAVEIFRLSSHFPADEKYSLTDQIRRSSRSVCANLAEAWRKRRYRAAFISKLNDCEAEACETQVWLDFAEKFHYLDSAAVQTLREQYEQILGQLVRMIAQPEKWVLPGQP